MVKAYFFDTETSGLIDNRSIKINKQPEIIEFFGCMADLSTGETSEELDLLIRPTMPEMVTEKITQITGLTFKDHLATAPFMSSTFPMIKGALEKAPLIIGHNLSFDREMIEIEADRLNTNVSWPKRLMCSVEQTVHIKGFRLSLSNLHELLFGEKFEGAHRARVDVQALIRCCSELFKRGLL